MCQQYRGLQIISTLPCLNLHLPGGPGIEFKTRLGAPGPVFGTWESMQLTTPTPVFGTWEAMWLGTQVP